MRWNLGELDPIVDGLVRSGAWRCLADDMPESTSRQRQSYFSNHLGSPSIEPLNETAKFLLHSPPIK